MEELFADAWVFNTTDDGVGQLFSLSESTSVELATEHPDFIFFFAELAPAEV